MSVYSLVFLDLFHGVSLPQISVIFNKGGVLERGGTVETWGNNQKGIQLKAGDIAVDQRGIIALRLLTSGPSVNR